jgi:hypothetical protein
MDVWRIHQGVILSLSEISMKRFDEFLAFLRSPTPNGHRKGFVEALPVGAIKKGALPKGKS